MSTQNWKPGAPTEPGYYLIEFAEGDRFNYVKCFHEEDEGKVVLRIEDLNDGGWVSDPIIQHAVAPKPSEESQPVQISDMVDWAKSRLRDDMEDYIKSMLLCSDAPDETLNRMRLMLAMPDNAPETLAALSVSYWNGKEDTFWESHAMPKGFVGFYNKEDNRCPQ